MESIKFINTNFDPSNSEFMTAAVAMAKAYGYTADLKLDKELAQLIRLRVATVNKCSYCGILHQETARKLNILQAKIDNLGSYWHSELFSEKEKAGCHFCSVISYRYCSTVFLDVCLISIFSSWYRARCNKSGTYRGA